MAFSSVHVNRPFMVLPTGLSLLGFPWYSLDPTLAVALQNPENLSRRIFAADANRMQQQSDNAIRTL